MVYTKKKSLKKKNRELRFRQSAKVKKRKRSVNRLVQKHKNGVIVQSLWVGPRLSRMEYYSIKSFLRLGFKYHLYTYEKVKNVPKGVIHKDANEIMPGKEIFDLKSTYLPFSDIWRYKMLHDKGNYWVDLDMIAIKMFDFKDEYVFSSERTIQEGAYSSYSKKVPNIGVLKAPRGSKFYLNAYEKCLEFNKKKKNDDKLKYMKMLRNLIKSNNMEKYVIEPSVFCNLDWWHSREAFEVHKTYPRKYGVTPTRLSKNFNGPYTVHFWRDRVTKKYGLDLDDEYDKDCLWEQMITMIDSK
jgi:hypothetical protein